MNDEKVYTEKELHTRVALELSLAAVRDAHTKTLDARFCTRHIHIGEKNIEFMNRLWEAIGIITDVETELEELIEAAKEEHREAGE